MVEPYETILDVLYVDQMLSGYLFQDYSNDSYEDMFYYIDKKLSEICLMNAGIYKICFTATMKRFRRIIIIFIPCRI